MNESSRPTPSPLSAEVESRPGLLRVLGPGMAMAMVVGNVIGSGIFLKPGGIAADAGSFSLIISTWVIAGGICLMGALCFAELAVMLPRAGGLYVYLREAYGRPIAFLFGWTEFLFSKPASIGALAVAFVGAFANAAGIELSVVAGILASLVVICMMTWINILGVIWGGRLQAFMTLIKAGFLAIIALLPFLLWFGGSTVVEFENYRSTVEPRQATFATQFAITMLAVMWAYNGWHGLTPVAEEIKNPRRNIPLALFGGIGVLIVLYVSVNVAYHSVLSMSEMAASGENAAQEMIHKLLAPSGERMAGLGVAAMSAVIMCSTFGAINSNILNGPRVSFAMGRDDVFFRGLGRVHVNYRTPTIAILVLSTMSCVLVIGAAVVVESVESLRDTNVFEVLTSFVVFAASIFYMLAVLAVIVLRRKHPDWERPYRTLGYPVVPVLYLAFYVWFLYYIFFGKPFEAQVGLILVGLGLPVYYGWKAWAIRHPEDLRDGQ